MLLCSLFAAHLRLDQMNLTWRLHNLKSMVAGVVDLPLVGVGVVKETMVEVVEEDEGEIILVVNIQIAVGTGGMELRSLITREVERLSKQMKVNGKKNWIIFGVEFVMKQSTSKNYSYYS